MFKGWTNRWDEIAVFVDTGASYLAYILAVHLYLVLINPHVATMQLVGFYFSFSFVVILVSWVALKLNFKGYSRRWNQLPAEMGMLLLSNLGSVTALAVLIFAFKATWFSRMIFVLFPALAFLFQVFVHTIAKVGVGKIRLTGRDQRHLVVMGHPHRVETFSHTVDLVPEAGMRVVAVFPLALGDHEVGNLAVRDLRRLLAETVVDSVVLVLPITDDVMMEVLSTCRRQGKEVRMVLDEVGVLARRSRLYDFYGNSVLVVESWRHQVAARAAIKRAMDVVVASLGLIFSLPIMLTAAVAIKFEDPSAPILFGQERVGLNGRRFRCYKFRTMVPNAEALREKLSHLNVMSGPVFKIPDDPRVTRVGKFLRRASLDELPQLFNVVKGDMSMVGPRPALPAEVMQYDEAHRRRLSVKPGLTCLWQISGRSEVDFKDWMELDMEYIDSWSIGLDLKIMAKTIPAVLQQKGAH